MGDKTKDFRGRISDISVNVTRLYSQPIDRRREELLREVGSLRREISKDENTGHAEKDRLYIALNAIGSRLSLLKRRMQGQ